MTVLDDSVVHICWFTSVHILYLLFFIFLRVCHPTLESFSVDNFPGERYCFLLTGDGVSRAIFLLFSTYFFLNSAQQLRLSVFGSLIENYQNMLPGSRNVDVLITMAMLAATSLAAYPFYNWVNMGVSNFLSVYYEDKNAPWQVRVTWWGSFVIASANTAKQVVSVCQECVDRHEDPPWDCVKESLTLGQQLIGDTISLVIGWNSKFPWKGSIEGGDQHTAKRELSPLSLNNTYVDGSVVSAWLYDRMSDSAAFPNRTILDAGPILTKRGYETSGGRVLYRDDTTGKVYDLHYNPAGTLNGRIAISEMEEVEPSSSGNSTLTKRDYTHYAPLCHGYMALDYCANDGALHFLKDGALDWQTWQLLNNDINGEWTADAYKLYTCDNDDCSSQSWQLSIKLYYAAQDVCYIYYDHCDTGH